jgi:hypothetical protein
MPKLYPQGERRTRAIIVPNSMFFADNRSSISLFLVRIPIDSSIEHAMIAADVTLCLYHIPGVSG